MDIEYRISKLNEKMQEYIEQGKKIGIIDENNIERVVSRLERVIFSVDNNIVGDAYTTVNRDKKNIEIRINENKMEQAKNDGKFYFEDEVLFHEFTHAINNIYENVIETGDAFKFKKNYLTEIEKDDYVDDYNFIKDYMSEDEKKKFDSYVNDDNLKLAGYGWTVLDEFVAQSIAQKMVTNKYKDNGIYPIKPHNAKISNPEYRFYTDLADYEVFAPFATKFIESMYGSVDITKFCKESLDSNFVEKVFEEFKNRPEGLEHLYKMLGNMGNIYFSDGIQKGHMDEEQINRRDPNRFSENKDNIYKSINDFMDISATEIKFIKNKEKQKEDVSEGKTNEKTEHKKESMESFSIPSRKKEKSHFDEMEQMLLNQLNSLVKNMSEDYVNMNHSREQEYEEQYTKIIDLLVDLRILKSGIKISNLDKMMEKRRLDATVSNLILACREHTKNVKFNNSTEKSEVNYNYEIKHLREYLKSDIELQDGTKIKLDKSAYFNSKQNEDKKVSDNKNENLEKIEEEQGNEKKEDIQKFSDKKDIPVSEKNNLKIMYSAGEGKYVVENSNEVFEDNNLNSKRDKINYIKDNFSADEMEYIFGNELKKSLKKCDFQLLAILHKYDIDAAKLYVEKMNNKDESIKLPFSMVYNMGDMKKNSSLSLLDKIRLHFNANKHKHINGFIINKHKSLLSDSKETKLDEGAKESFKKDLAVDIKANPGIKQVSKENIEEKDIEER